MRIKLLRFFANSIKTTTAVKMKTLVLLMIVNTLCLSYAHASAQNKKIRIKKGQFITVENIFKIIEDKTDYTFLYRSDLLKNAPLIKLKKGKITIEELLQKGLSPINCTFELNDNLIVVKKKARIRLENADIQQDSVYRLMVTGDIVDENEDPVVGATISIKGSDEGTITDLNGYFSLSCMSNSVLVVSSLGLVTQEIPVDGKKYISISLATQEKTLDEILITGYQKLDVNKAAGSYNKVDMSQFEKKLNPDIASALEGLSPALTISTNPATNSKELTIRGVSTLQGSASPLIIVDGFPYEGDLSTINPYEVESITLLKDAASASIYGAKSANGVIVITTKKGKKGKLEFRYMNNFQFSDQPDIEYVMNRVSSSELVDMNTDYYNNYPYPAYFHSYRYWLSQGRRAMPYVQNKVINLYLAEKEGLINKAELNKQIAYLKTVDNTSDLKTLLLNKNPMTQQHNLSASYGDERFQLRTYLNYLDEKSGFKGKKNDRFTYNINTVLDFSKRFRLDMSANLNFGNNQSYLSNPSDLYKLSSYERFYDNSGNPLAVTLYADPSGRNTNSKGLFGGKDDYEIKRLVSLGLLDETYYPAADYGRSTKDNKDWNARFQAQLQLELFEGLTAKVAFNYNKGNVTYQEIRPVSSWSMRSLINNLTTKNTDGTKGELLIPMGGRIKELRGDNTSYMLRGQLDFHKNIENHSIIALLGSEIQSIQTTNTITERFGYNKSSNIFREIDYFSLSQNVSNVFHPNGSVQGGLGINNSFEYIENRYFSLYGNLNYSFMQKYILSGSIRIDQSNLFGTDPRYRFKPFWSAAAKWRIAEEATFIGNIFSKFDLQVSYGINGNISNEYGPFDIAYEQFINIGRNNSVRGLTLNSYSVPDLRWEKTQTFNIGLHTSLYDNRIAVSFDYYRKNSIDILASAEADPTLGSNYIVRNDATISNNGYEVVLSTININTQDFSWRSYLNLSYNQSKVEKIYEKDEYAFWIAGNVRNRLGYEPRSLYVFEWAGVDENGNGMVKRANGDLYNTSGRTPGDLQLEDLHHAGTTLPKLVMGLTNNFSYKNISLSFMFVYQGGHVLLRDSYNGGYIAGIDLVNKEAAMAWKKKGDEKNTNVPRIGSVAYTVVTRGSTKNIIKGDFIRLRDVVLSYTIPVEATKTLRINEITLNARASNLYLWTKNSYGIDPETQGLGQRNLPLPKTFSVGINVTF